ncbi:hypothetical protein [Pseudoramibacter alactolyticus]|uniref:hypothetical protein n=1 Tax=Pseudoramibacter alactolyticus TaxID=113287 RepID=UPI0028F00C2F|nr:hypothetical protein [Pseudoramibacter alactolyticus]
MIGIMDKDKPTWTLAAHVGIIGHDRPLLSAVPAWASGGREQEDQTRPAMEQTE